MQNDDFTKEFNAALAEAKAIEDSWGKKSSENAEMIQKFPSNKQYKNSFSACIRCPNEKFSRKEIREGCRMNGDAWGKIVQYCPECGFCESWTYDEY